MPRERWVFPWAGAEVHERWFVSERADLAAAPALGAAGRAALEHAGVGIDDVGLVDLYSCFPIAVQIAAAELGLPLDDPARPLTLTGGLTFAGGPGNDYSMHSIATAVARLRDEPEAVALTTAVGWYMTKHAVGVYSGSPPENTFRRFQVEPELPPAREVALDDPGSDATIEAYTVGYGREGKPDGAVVSALTSDGERSILRADDEVTLDALVDGDPLGHPLAADRHRLTARTSANPTLSAGVCGRSRGSRDLTFPCLPPLFRYENPYEHHKPSTPPSPAQSAHSSSRAARTPSQASTCRAAHARSASRAPGRRRPSPSSTATEQLNQYFAGERTEFDLPLRSSGSDFEQTVWAELERIPYGETASYGEIAKRIGRPDRARAVGSANGRNPISIIVPCHRVIGADGSLTGYGGGLERKQFLLDLEQGTARLV